MLVSHENYNNVVIYNSWRIPLMVEIDKDIIDVIRILKIMFNHLNIMCEMNKLNNTNIIYYKGRPANMEIRILKDITKYYIEFFGITSRSIEFADDIKKTFIDILKKNDETQIKDMCKIIVDNYVRPFM